ncbi:hypothetical protein GC177_00145 [bacterium]|nr:hypothetical protein [bacterium]
MKGMKWGQAAETVATTMALRRSVGTVVQAAVNKYTVESFKTDDTGAPLRQQAPARLIRGAADVMDKGYDALFGKDRSRYEITEEGRKALGIRADVTDEAIEKGYFRKRFYNLHKEEKDIPDEARPQHRAKSYGRRFMEISTDFACMGQADYVVNRLYLAAKDGLRYIHHNNDPAFRNSPEFAEWKKKQSLPRAIGKIGYDMVENAIRGDFTYDYFIGIFYTPIKEFFSRKRSSENSELKNTHIHYNIPFVAYNWIGMLVWQDLLVDWWLRPSQSKLREYMHAQPERESKGLGRLWNGLVDIASFCAVRTFQIGTAMYPAVSVGFSPGRHYGEMAAKELKEARDHMLIERLFTELPLRMQEICKKKSIDLPLDKLQLDTLHPQLEKTPQNLRTAFEEREKLLMDHLALRLPAAVHDELLQAREQISKSFFEECLHEQSKSVTHAFYKDYINGDRPVDAIRKPENLKIEQQQGKPGLLDDVNDSLVAMQDEVGHQVKKYTALHSAGLQGLFLAELNVRNALTHQEATAEQYKSRVELADASAERYAGYAPYFALKRTFTDFTWKDPSVNLVSQAVSWVLDHLKLGDKANHNLATGAGQENSHNAMRHDPQLAQSAAQHLPEQALKANNAPQHS